MRHLGKSWSRCSRVAVQLMLVAAMVVTLLAMALPAVGAAGEGEGGATLEVAPLNPAYVAFLENPPAEFYGDIPPSIDLSHVGQIPVERSHTSEQVLPSSYDWRDYGKVSSVKDQSPCGTCWAFATTSALEASALMSESIEYDLSEQSVAMCVDRSWVYLYDPPTGPCTPGGNAWLASEVFIRKGAVLESCNPYNGSALNCDGTCVCDSCAAVKMVDGFRVSAWDDSDTNAIKQAIYDYGPHKVSYYHSSGYEYWDATWGAIYDYYPDPGGTNHAVTVVGWDDSVPHPNTSHGGTGAWLIKNSWGTSDPWAGGPPSGGISDGYFYLAYDSSRVERVIYLEYKDPVPGEGLLYWDEAGQVGSAGYGDGNDWMASVFTADQAGSLTHVDFWTTSNNAGYEIYVWDGSFGSQLAHQTGTCQEAGYYSIPLSSPISLSAAQQFTLGVDMTTPGYGYPIPIESVEAGTVEPTIQSGVSFISDNGSAWEDLAGYDWNGCLRARVLTSAVENTITGIEMTPPSPANMLHDEHVYITFDYSTNEAGGVFIFTEPYTDGSRTIGAGSSPSPLYPVGTGIGRGWFTIGSGEVTVDQVRFTMTNASQTEDLLDFFVDVEYNYGYVGECRVLFDDSHDADGDDIDGNYLDFAEALRAQGYRVDQITRGPIQYYVSYHPTLSAYDVLVLCDPEIAFTADEQFAILKFVEEGGGLFALGENYLNETVNPNLNEVIETTGIHLNADMIHDPTNHHATYTQWPLIHEFATSHPVRDGLGSISLIGGSSMNVESPAYELAWGDADSYVEYPAGAAYLGSSSEGDLGVGAAGENPSPSETVTIDVTGAINAETPEPVTIEIPAAGHAPGYDVNSSWATSIPTTDGYISAGEWSDASMVDITPVGVSLTVTMYVKNDGSKLYLAFDDPNDATFSSGNYDQIGVYFDDEPSGAHDGAWTYAQCPSGEGNFWAGEFAPSPPTEFRGIAAGPVFCTSVEPAPGVDAGTSITSGHVQYETAIDLSASELKGSPGDEIGMFFYVLDNGPYVMNGYWPETAIFDDPLTYGDVTLATGQVANPIAVAASEYVAGKVVVIGDSSLVTNTYVSLYDNELFGINAIDWLAECEPAGVPDIDVTPASLEITLDAGATGQLTLNVANVGGADLEVSNICDEETAVPLASEAADIALGSAEDLSLPAASISAAADTRIDPADNEAMAILDDFNRPDGPIGPNWTDQNSTFSIVSNAAQGGTPEAWWGLATYNGVTADAIEADVEVDGTTGQYTGLVLAYADIDNNYFIKIQQQDSSGQFHKGAFYYGNNNSLSGLFFDLDYPLSTAHMKVELVGTTVTLTLSNINGGSGTQTYSYDYGSSTGGNAIGICGWQGTARIDNFATSGAAPCACDPDALWMSASPTSGTVNPSAVMAVTVEFDAAALSAGVYEGNIKIASNDPDEGCVVVPVTLTVVAEPDIWVDPLSFDVTLPPDSTWSDTLTIGNDGVATLNYNITDEETTPAASAGAGQGQLEFIYQQEVGVSADEVNASDMTSGLRAAYTWQDEAASPSILVYTDDPYMSAGNTYVEQALQALGFSYTGYYADYDGFGTALTTGGPWDLVLVSHTNWLALGNWWSEIEDYVNAGGTVVIETFDIDGSSSEPTTLWTTLGVSYASDMANAEPVYRWQTSHPIFTLVENVPDLSTITHAFGDDGDKCDAVSPTVAVAGFTGSETAGQGALFTGSIVNSCIISEFRGDDDSDGKLDVVELWQNEIAYVLGGPDCPWLDENPKSGSVAAASSDAITVEIDTTGMTEGDYSADIIVASNDPDENPTIVPVTLTVVPSVQCGDVNCDGLVNMADVQTLWYDLANYPAPDVWTICNEWAADVNCDGLVNMADVQTLWYDLANYPAPDVWQINCCDS